MSGIHHLPADNVSDDISDSDSAYIDFRTINTPGTDRELTSTVDESSLQENAERNTKLSNLKSCCLKCCEKLLLIILIVIVWLLLSLPSVFFILAEIGNDPINNSTSNATNGDIGSNESCVPVEYRGSFCKTSLESFQSCLYSNATSSVYIPSSVDAAENENKITAMFSYKRFFSSECYNNLKPVGCLYLFPLCNSNTKKVVRLPSEQCNHTKRNVCKRESKIADDYGFGAMLPQCDTLPTDIRRRKRDCSQIIHHQTSKPTCREDFDPVNGTCVPICKKWSPYTKLELRLSNVAVILSAAFAIFSGTIVLILSCMRFKKVFRYPSIFVVYQTIPTIVLGVIILIGYIDRETLFCKFKNLEESRLNPTPFCTLSGVCLYYITAQLILLWLFHVIAIFWGIVWPIHASTVLTSVKRAIIHIIAVLLALILPVIPVVLINYSPGGFTMTRFPPIVCAGSHLKINFYAFLLPMSVVIAAGLSLMILTLWSLLKKRVMHHVRHTRINTNWETHTRILLIMCYFVLVGIVVLTTLTVSLVNYNMFNKKLTTYLMCETSGVDKNALASSAVQTDSCDKKSVSSLVNPITTIIAFIIIGFYPAVNLVFVIHMKDLKEKCFCCKQTRQVEYIYHANRPYSHYRDGWNSTQASGTTRARQGDSETKHF